LFVWNLFFQFLEFYFKFLLKCIEFIKNQIQVFRSGYNYYKYSIQKKIFTCSYLNLDIIFSYLPIEFYKFNNIIKYQQEFIKNILVYDVIILN
jgi:hypothetical protein